MQDYILERTIAEAEYIALTKCTVRQCAKEMSVSKSTVHTDINERLNKIDISLYDEVKAILEDNFRVRHIRGGISTKAKFERKRKGSVA